MTSLRLRAVAGLAAVAAVAAGCGGGGGGADDENSRVSGPVAALYVTDHDGAEPPDHGLVPYETAFRRIRAGCEISAEELANRVLHLADSASKGSGLNVTNLQALRAVASRVGTARHDCTSVLVTTEALLGGGAMGG